MLSAKSLLTAALSLALAMIALAQDVPAPTPAMREVSPGVYEIGKLRLDQNARTVTFPGALNLQEGNLEYLLVTPEGSTHESLLVSEVAPNEVHFAMLLLGAKGSGHNAPAPGDVPPGQIDAKFLKSAPKLKGESIQITVRWKADEMEKSAPVEDWIFNTATKKPMERGPWTYTGSMFNDGHFLAQIEGAHAALVTYPSALINNPRKGNDDDQIWTVNTKAVPPARTPVEIIILLPASSDAKP
jgi:hypothetical protein